MTTDKLDILTERGQQSVSDEQAAIKIWERHYPDFKYIETPKHLPAKVDAILIKQLRVAGIVETKCRYKITLESFQTVFNNEWLVTFEKLDEARLIARALCVPLYGFLYLVDDKTLLVQKITNETGDIIVGFRSLPTETQKTINGGTITRVNAFINMSQAKVFYAEGIESAKSLG